MSTNHRISSGRATLAATVLGTGDPVVFLHASICDSRMWCEQMAGVAISHQAIAYDRRGFGETEACEEGFSAVADLIAVLNALAQDKPATLVACSQGARIALDAALQHPAYVRALVLISPTVSGAPDAKPSSQIRSLMGQLEQAQGANDLDKINAGKARLFLDGPLQAEGRVTGVMRQLFLDMHGKVLRTAPTGASHDAVSAFQRLGEIAVPSLVIAGSFDFPHIHDRSRQVASLVANGTFCELPGAAHLPSLDRPRELTRLITTFIQDFR